MIAFAISSIVTTTLRSLIKTGTNRTQIRLSICHPAHPFTGAELHKLALSPARAAAEVNLPMDCRRARVNPAPLHAGAEET